MTIRNLGRARNIHPTALVPSTARVGPRVTICRMVRVGAYAQLDGKMTIGEGTLIGSDVILINTSNVVPNTIVPCPGFMESLTRYVCLYSWSRCGVAA